MYCLGGSSCTLLLLTMLISSLWMGLRSVINGDPAQLDWGNDEGKLCGLHNNGRWNIPDKTSTTSLICSMFVCLCSGTTHGLWKLEQKISVFCSSGFGTEEAEEVSWLFWHLKKNKRNSPSSSDVFQKSRRGKRNGRCALLTIAIAAKDNVPFVSVIVSLTIVVRSCQSLYQSTQSPLCFWSACIQWTMMSFPPQTIIQISGSPDNEVWIHEDVL